MKTLGASLCLALLGAALAGGFGSLAGSLAAAAGLAATALACLAALKRAR